MSRFFVSAGETSGDFHAATVVAELKHRFPDCAVHGIAGGRMQAAGCTPIHSIDELNVMGIGDVLRSLSRIRAIERSILEWCARERPDVAVLVDFSSFHMRLGRKLRALGIPVVHFIAPKLWAWGAWRVKKLKRSQDRLACILPFEPEWFAERGIGHAQYVGNPSAVACKEGWSRAELRAKLGIADDRPLLALLPGSRKQELRAHVEMLADTLSRLKSEIPNLACIVPVAPGVDETALAPLWHAGAMRLSRNEAGYALRADAAVAVSGTATLELALWDVPTVLVYNAPPVMAFLARRLLKLRCVGLANIILGDQPVMPELLQDACTAANAVDAVKPLLSGSEPASAQRAEFDRLRARLGDKPPAIGVVDMVETLLQKKD